MESKVPIRGAGATIRPEVWRRGTLFVSLLVFLAYSSFVILRRPYGFNYDIYTYFSKLYWEGENPYHARDVAPIDVNKSFREPRYLDYSGAQLAIYNAAFYVTHHFRVDGLTLYSLLLLLTSLIVAHRLSGLGMLGVQEYVFFTLLLLSPYVWYRLFVFSYEDKALYILLPLAILYGRSKSINVTGFLIGLATGLVGVAAALYPLLGLSILRDPTGRRKDRIKAIFAATTFMLLGIVLAWLPFFPDSLLAWKRRALLESGSPVWFSFLNLLGPLYVPRLNGVLILLACLLCYGLFAANRLEFKTAIILVISCFFLFSVQMGPQRMVPVVVALVLVFRWRLPRTAFFVSGYALLLVFLFLDVSAGFFQAYPKTLALAQTKSAILMSPVLLGYLLVILDNLSHRRPCRP